MINLLETQQTLIFSGVFLWLLVLSVLFYKSFFHYKRLVGKTKRGDLVDILNQQMGTMNETNIVLKNFKEKLTKLESGLPNNLKKVGLVRFNPFRQLGGNQSFSLALLDEDSNGVVLSALHSKDSTRVYAKPVVDGKEADYTLSDEEKEAVKIAKVLKSKT